MNHLVLTPVPDWYSRGGQPGRVRLALIAQRIMFGSDDDGGRQAGQVNGMQRADRGISAQRRIGDALVAALASSRLTC